LMGDLNTWQGTPDYYSIANLYMDGWLSALYSGTASSYNGTGATEGLSRLDYIFLSNGISLDGVAVPYTVVDGVKPSDHDPVVAQLRIW